MAKDVKRAEQPLPVRHRSRSMEPNFQQEIEQFFSDRWPRMFDSPFYQGGDKFDLPRVDVLDKEAEVIVRAELAGFSKKEVDESVNDSTVTIKAAKKSESEDKEEDFYRREFSSSSMSRTVSLPAEVDGDKARAKFTDGMLELTVPKLKKSTRQKVKIED